MTRFEIEIPDSSHKNLLIALADPKISKSKARALLKQIHDSIVPCPLSELDLWLAADIDNYIKIESGREHRPSVSVVPAGGGKGRITIDRLPDASGISDVLTDALDDHEVAGLGPFWRKGGRGLT